MTDKIQLKDPRPTRTIELPSFPGSKVEIWPSVLARDLVALNGIEGAAAGIASLPFYIKGWNFDEEVTKEAVEKLPDTDLVFIFAEIKAFQEAQKKTSVA